MVSINYAFKEIISKIVYYGPGLSGKTTNLQYVFSKVPKETRGELISLATDADRTLYFDFLPVNVGNIRGFSTKFQLYTVPGQVYYNATRKLVLRGVDGLVFVADSQIEKMDDNIESLKNLEENLAEYGYDIKDIPMVLQYNKRDLPNIATIEEMQRQLNPRGLPYFEAVASTGVGVFATLKAISKMVLDKAKQSSPEKPSRQEPVVVSVGSGDPHISSATKPEPAPQVSRPREVVMEPSMKVFRIEDNQGKSDLLDTKPPQPEDKMPPIVTASETLTNVVVSSAPEETEAPPAETRHEDLEETTEHSVLKEESLVPQVEPPIIKKHPAILDADKLKDIYLRKPDAGQEEGRVRFDEEATQIAEPIQQPQMLSKPHMAESTRVKQKKKFGLFGWIKKKSDKS